MNQAISEAIAAEMESDSSVVLLGEDVGAAGGVFKASDGLFERFGAARVRDTPISEMGFMGLAVGAAALGLRPVIEIMFVEFAGVALDQITTEAAKMRYLSRGQYSSPITVRMSSGPGLGFGAQHSQTLENWFVNTPGLKVVELSGAESAYWLTRAAIRDPDPVVVLEPRVLYGSRENVDLAGSSRFRIGAARSVRDGSDLTVVACGQTVATAVAGVEAAGVDADVLDLGTVYPWDVEAVLASVARTGLLMTVEANPYSGGWGGAVVSEIATRGFGALKAPPERVACPDTPVPYAPNLEDAYVPSPSIVAAHARRMTDQAIRSSAHSREGAGR